MPCGELCNEASAERTAVSGADLAVIVFLDIFFYSAKLVLNADVAFGVILIKARICYCRNEKLFSKLIYNAAEIAFSKAHRSRKKHYNGITLFSEFVNCHFYLSDFLRFIIIIQTTKITTAPRLIFEQPMPFQNADVLIFESILNSILNVIGLISQR